MIDEIDEQPLGEAPEVVDATALFQGCVNATLGDLFAHLLPTVPIGGDFIEVPAALGWVRCG